MFHFNLKKSNIKLKILISLFIFTILIIITQYLKNNFKNIEDEKIIISSFYKKNLIKHNNNTSTYILPKDNLLHLNIKSNKFNELSHFIFDDNKLKIVSIDSKNNTIHLISDYEITPGKNKLQIIHKNGSKEEYIFNVKYLFDIQQNPNIDINHSWTSDEKECIKYIPTQGIKLGGNCQHITILMEYDKNFNKDVSLEIEFTPIINKTTDFKLSFGERIYFNFDNHHIRIKRKESITNTIMDKTIKTPDEIPYKHFRKGIKYKIKFIRNKNIYKLLIDGKETATFIDDMNNSLPSEKYKNIRIGVGNDNMTILINKIVIE